MRAAVLQGWGKPLVVVDRPDPEPKPGDARVRIRVSGVCHSDVHMWKGEWPAEKSMMESAQVSILGHEGIGLVDGIGAGVTALHEGQRVGIPWMNSWCGACEPCLTGYAHWCPQTRTTSVTVNGTFAEYATISERAAVPIPDEIGDDEAAPLMCAGVTAYGALRRLTTELRIPPGKLIAIVGAAGGLGHYGVQLAKALGYRVLAVDVGEERVRFAKELGADFAADASEAKSLARSLGGVHASVVFTPRISGYALAAKLGRETSGLVAVGIPGVDEGPIPVTPSALIGRGTRIIPASVGVTHEFEELFALYREGKIRSHLERRGTLSDLNDILTDLAGSKFLARAVVTL